MNTAPPLLATKLFVPRPRRTLIPRARLNERLTATLAAPVTLVAAPAGFGKTTAVSAWAAMLDRPVAWLALDEADNDPARFLHYLFAALQRIDPAVGSDLNAAAGNGDALLAALVNDVAAAAADFVLVLDDYHVVDHPAVHGALQAIVAHQPPNLHLVIVTREDPPLPLARLRARGELVEVRAADLRFTAAEAILFLNQTMGLALDAATVAALDERVEGWIAGLQLAALSLQSAADPAAVIAELDGSHHFILGYLADEVLRLLPPDRQAFLRETSVLDRLCGPLCDAVTAHTGSDGVLAELYAANVFVVALDDAHRWFRYHALFRDLLRRQLERTAPDLVPTLYARASAWFEAEGDAIAAIEHALAAGDAALTVRLLEVHARAIVLRGEARLVDGWIQRLPAEWRGAGPQANLACAWALLLRGSLDAIEPYLQAAEAAAATGAEPAIRAECLALRAGLVSLRGDPERGCRIAQEAVDLAPADDDYVRGMTRFCLATACNYAGRVTQAVEHYQAALPLCLATGNTVAAMLIIGNLTMLYQARGQLQRAADLCRQTIDDAARRGQDRSPALASVHGGLGDVLLARHDLDAAREQLAVALTLGRRSGHVATLTYSHTVLSRLEQAAGHLDAAERALAEALALRERGMPAWVAPHVVAQQVALALARDDAAAAEAALARTGVSAGQPTSHTLEIVHMAHLRLLLHRGRSEGHAAALDEAYDLANRLLASAQPADRMGRVLGILLLRALVQLAQGDPAAALADLHQSLLLAESERYITPYVAEGEPLRALLAALRRDLARGERPADAAVAVEYIDALLAAMPAPAESGDGSAAPVDLVEPLTDREQEVLNLLAQGLTYQEMADRLIVSINTVRYHVKSLYGKLGVDNRTAALDQARTLGYLER